MEIIYWLKLLSVKRAERHFCMELNISVESRGVLSPLRSSQISASAIDTYVLLRSINLQPRHIFFYHIYSKKKKETWTFFKKNGDKNERKWYAAIRLHRRQ